MMGEFMNIAIITRRDNDDEHTLSDDEHTLPQIISDITDDKQVELINTIQLNSFTDNKLEYSTLSDHGTVCLIFDNISVLLFKQ